MPVARMGRVLAALALMLAVCAAQTERAAPRAGAVAKPQQAPPRDITLQNSAGLKLVLTPIGAAIHRLFVPVCGAAKGKSVDVALGFDDVSAYAMDPHPSFGATVGRVGNRISGAQFSVDGRTHKLLANEQGKHSIHGGAVRWSKAVWDTKTAPDGRSVTFTYVSRDGEAGFPGTVRVATTYAIPEDGLAVNISMTATTDKATPLNILNHNYFNLAGTGDILGHSVQINSHFFTPSPPGELLPTGQVASVHGTVYDFTAAKPIGRDVQAANGGPYRGFDLNYVMPSPGGAHDPVWWTPGQNPQTAEDAATRDLAWGATVVEPKSGLKLQVFTNAPGLHFYSGNFLGGKNGAESAGAIPNKGGIKYKQHTGFCFETQAFPNAVNTPGFPSSIVRPGEAFSNRVSYKFEC